ncbi:hypothetical protein Tco_1579929, partial [Tanacetum coccineum]
ATAFPLSVPLHKSKTLKKDPFPKPSRYNVEFDENSYPSFLDDNNEVMDLFSFIHHAEPTKVRMGEMEKAGDQVPLLEATRGRVVPLAPPILVTEASSEGNMTKSID